ncbi:hypothetical protein CKO_04270 [Citrobacter koseri ATCC BAA-895]|uniref:Uncharacterized protein n=1 Tax=Citrobacter koseri (strain ATCC BAA-895 / CDC 4225-83 / SGSC4696) TaxID=290338 RepID=A8APB5_CITK8|nr:hypothetical protein CKO_04270 [Citrobacter koseri ATCC BAA-895]
MVKSSPRNPASQPLQGFDANVLFYLNLPPKQTLNHKAKLTITLAYDQKTPNPPQHKKPQNKQTTSINDNKIRNHPAHTHIKCGKNVKNDDS